MKESFQRWLQDDTLVAGLLGCGVRFPDHSSLNQSYTESLPELRLDQIWQRLFETVNVLHSQQLAPTRLVWMFEENHLHLALRPDGIGLGLVTTPDASESPAVAELVERFLAFSQ